MEVQRLPKSKLYNLKKYSIISKKFIHSELVILHVSGSIQEFFLCLAMSIFA